MIISLAIIILLGMIVGRVFEKINLPDLLGMLILGILIGPHFLNLISNDMLIISSDLRKLALIIILIRAGLGINKDKLSKIGKVAFKMSFIPGMIEGLVIALISTKILGFSFIEGGILGFIIAAVSPAVVVPQMLNLLNKKLGTKKGIPTLILTSSSVDDVIAITFFSIFLGMYGGKHINIGFKILSIPVAIIIGIMIGMILGIFICYIFNKFNIRNTKKLLIVLAFGIIIEYIEIILENYVMIAGLLGVMMMGYVIKSKKESLAKMLSFRFEKLWVIAKIILFVLVGAEVDMNIALNAGLKGLLIIFIGILARSIGVVISTMNSNLNKKEIMFCVFAYIPKATVQAAIGAVPIAYGVKSGEVILAISVLSILITAPIGSILINNFSGKLLTKN